MAPFLTVVNNNTIYDFDYVGGVLMESPSNLLRCLKPLKKKIIVVMGLIKMHTGMLLSLSCLP